MIRAQNIQAQVIHAQVKSQSAKTTTRAGFRGRSLAAGLTLLLGVTLWVPSAQARRIRPRPDAVVSLPELDRGAFTALLEAQRHVLISCKQEMAPRSVGLVTVRARVLPRGRHSTLRESNLRFEVRADGAPGRFETCVRRNLRRAIRRAPFVVTRPLRVRRTFQVTSPAPPPPLPTYSERSVRSLLQGQGGRFARCTGPVGGGEVSMRLRIEPNGRLVIRSISLAPGIRSDPRACLQRVISSLRINPAPRRPQELVHILGRR